MRSREAPSGVRPLVGVLSFLLAVGLVASTSRIIGLEAWMARHVFEWAGLGPTRAGGQPDRFVALGVGAAVQYRITVQCGVAMLMAPFVLVAGLVATRRSVGRLRLSMGCWLGLLTLLTANQVRMLTIGWGTRLGGLQTGFEIAHLLVGALITLAGVAVALLVLFRVARPVVVPRRVAQPRPQGAVVR